VTITQTGAEQQEIEIQTEKEAHNIKWDSQGKYLAISRYGYDTVQIWSADTQTSRTLTLGKVYNRDIEWSPRPDRSILACYIQYDCYSKHDMQVQVWDAETGTCLHYIKTGGYYGGAYSLSFSPTGGHLAWVSNAGIVTVWSVETGQLVGNLKGQVGQVKVKVNATKWSHCGGELAVITKEGRIKLFDTKEIIAEESSKCGEEYQFANNQLLKELDEVKKNIDEKEATMEYMKTYKCKISDNDFLQEDKKFIQKRVQDILFEVTKCPMDLKFVKDIILEEHTEEIEAMDFEVLDLEQLPWSSLIFEAVNIEKGSTILIFNLGFKDTPTNEDDLNKFRLIELVVLTIIENLQFIKGIKEFKTERKEGRLVLSASIEAHKFDESCIKEIMISLRGSLKHIVGDEIAGIAPSAEDVEIYLQDLFKHKSEDLNALTNLKLTPLSMRRIAEVIKESQITNKDLAEIKIELDTTARRNSSVLLEASSRWLFPYNFRKLSDLEPQMFKDMIAHTKDLPTEKDVVYKHFIYNLDVFENKDSINLAENFDQAWPYPNIIEDFKEHGGTLGGLLDALNSFKDKVDGEKAKASIAKFVQVIMKMREDMYENILENIYCPSQSSSVQNFEDFQKMAREKGLKIKTNAMEPFETLKGYLVPGDQLWIFHQRKLVRSYAHVVIVLDLNKFMHVTAPKRFHRMLMMESKIKEEDLQKLQNEKFCFIVRPSSTSDGKQDIFSKRAVSCKGIRFDYDPETSNCETFCNGVHGIWTPSVQGQDIRGPVQHGFSAYSKLNKFVKKEEENLTKKMQKQIQMERLLLSNEIFDSVRSKGVSKNIRNFMPRF